MPHARLQVAARTDEGRRGPPRLPPSALDARLAGVEDGAVEWQILSGLEPEQRRLVLAAARRRQFRRGEVVFHRDDPGDTLHLVVSGRFALRVVTPDADSVAIAVRGPGELFGELAPFSDAPRSATVSALEPGETRALHRSALERLLAASPELQAMFVRQLAEELRRTTALLVEALYVPAHVRIRRRLAELAERGGPVVRLTQEEVAELAGSTRTTVNRVLREEARRGTLELARGRTTVLDPDALRAGASRSRG